MNLRHIIKRLFDFLVAAVSLVLLLPLLAIIAVLVFVDMGWPLFYCPRRAGRNGRPFTMVKFRTMRGERDRHGNVLSDFERTTRLSRFLRSASLDELPELINVLRGEMSLVGPRPLLVEYLDRYTPEQARRIEAKPGITGWAQVNGRNSISWEEKFRLDVWYVDNWSLRLDMRILMKTVGIVLGRKGVKNAEHEVNMPEFMGSPQPCPEGASE